MLVLHAVPIVATPTREHPRPRAVRPANPPQLDTTTHTPAASEDVDMGTEGSHTHTAPPLPSVPPPATTGASLAWATARQESARLDELLVSLG
jgi:hypothetical protein